MSSSGGNVVPGPVGASGLYRGPLVSALAPTATVWAQPQAVDGVAEFGIDNTGAVADNSATINAALLALAPLGLDLFIPTPKAGGPGLVKIQNPIVQGNGSPGVISTIQGGRVIGAGFAGTGQAVIDSTPYAHGMTEIRWNGAAGGNMWEIQGPLQGWGMEHLYLNCAGLAIRGIWVLSGQYGEVVDVAVDGSTGVGIIEDCQTGVFAASVADALHNTWRKMYVNVPVGATGVYIGATPGTGQIADTAYSDWKDLVVHIGVNPASPTYGLAFGVADTCTVENYHLVASPGPDVYAISWEYQITAFHPSSNKVINPDLGGCQIRNRYNTPNAAAHPNIMSGMNQENGITAYPNLPNLIWQAPNAPVGILTTIQPAVPASGTSYLNNLGIPVTVYVAGGTVTAISAGSAALFGATGMTSGPIRLMPGDYISITYSVAPTWVWMGD